jgi:hypothetical protein
MSTGAVVIHAVVTAVLSFGAGVVTGGVALMAGACEPGAVAVAMSAGGVCYILGFLDLNRRLDDAE